MQIFLMLLLVLSVNVVAKDYTKPPSIALRTDISFVGEFKLVTKKFKSPNQWTLSFDLIKDYHNKSHVSIEFLVSDALAQSLEANVNYIVGYQTHHKEKIGGLNQIVVNPTGAMMINVEGAYPAIFRSNDLLAHQLQSQPQKATDSPQEFISKIIEGMFETDTKISEFFVRELINWTALHPHLTRENYTKLAQVISSSNASNDMMAAFFAARSNFQKSVGVKKIGQKAINLIKHYPIKLDPLSEVPNVVNQAMMYLNRHNMIRFEDFDRWMKCNIPSITEKAILVLNKMDSARTHSLIKVRLLDTHLNDASRRVLMRFER